MTNQPQSPLARLAELAEKLPDQIPFPLWWRDNIHYLPIDLAEAVSAAKMELKETQHIIAQERQRWAAICDELITVGLRKERWAAEYIKRRGLAQEEGT